MHNLNWDDLRYFIEVVRSGNVTEAGLRLGVNQSTVSRRVAQLENQLGKALFDRTAKGWVITPVGEKIVALAEVMANQANAIYRKVESDSEDISGLIKVTVSDVCAKRFVLPVIRDFKRDYPDVDFELIAAEEVLNLAGREADIAIHALIEPPPNVVGKRICRLAYYVYGHPTLWLNLSPETPPCITWIGDGVSLPYWIKKNFPKLKRAYRTNSSVAMFEMCREGLGLALLPCSLADEADELIRIPVEYTESGSDIWVLSHVDLRTTARVRVFRDRMVAFLTNEIDLLEGRKPKTRKMRQM
ncbi:MULTISPECIES: LysR family transcriptional regulator [Methylomicrobium]|uniref:Transcriptional regulator n=1 Tax=Methylomicrobium album BG8 TaxID=686340 RepID=H8GH63_METAL|nr:MULTISPECIES: LysR family transcriptional regulator [Methylomicrobium]EIC28854.1 transcriptional regulator [Methylomicrobium album BG8]